MRFVIALLLALGLFTSSAVASEPWVLVGKSERSHFYIYRGSLDVGTTSDGSRVFYVAGKYEIIATKESMLQVWYVPVQDCMRGSGKLYILDTNGQQITVLDFKPSDQSVAASLAKLICEAALGSLTDSKNKI